MGTSGNIYFLANDIYSDTVIVSMMNVTSDEIEWSFTLKDNPVKTFYVNRNEDIMFLAFTTLGYGAHLYVIDLDLNSVIPNKK